MRSGEDEISAVLPARNDIFLTRITLNMCCDFARTAGSIEVGNVLSKISAKVVFADRFGPGIYIEMYVVSHVPMPLRKK